MRRMHPDDRKLLEQAADALWSLVTASLTVKPNLDEPYDPPYEDLTPYTRWVERPAQRAHDLAMEIRKCLREAPDASC